MTIDSDRFIQLVRPALASRDAEQLAAAVKDHWTKEQLCELLATGSLDARRVVCLTLGLVGCRGCADCLAEALQDADPTVAELAEHAMWSIWFRSGQPESLAQFKQGLEQMNAGRFAPALVPLTRATETDPGFAEAWNQRAIAYYMLDDWERSLDDCLRAVDRLPNHFGALAGAGHCEAQMGDLAEAARYYREALAINPRMHAIAGALSRIEERIQVPA